MRKDCELYLSRLATSLVGAKRIEFLRERAKVKAVSNQIICQFFIIQIRQTVANMNPQTLGKICVGGSDFEKEGMLNRAGSNANLHMPALYEYDSGRTIMEKLATATILSAIRHLIDQGQENDPGRESWYPFQLHAQPDSDIRKFQEEYHRLVSETGW